MNLLLDTATYIWLINDDAQLSSGARTLIADPANRLYLSAASAWEIAIKHSKGQLELAIPVEAFLVEQRRLHWIESLPITENAVLLVGSLPLIHQDPFDRMIVAQALAEEMTILTSDRLVRRYPAPVVW